MGLLDFLNSDDAALGLGLLAAGGPTTDPNRSGFGARLAEGVGYAQQRKNAGMQQKLLQSQIDENASQAAQRQQQIALALRKQSALEEFTKRFGAGGGTPAAGGGLLGAAPGAAAAGGAAPQASAGGFPLTPNDIAAMKLQGLPDLTDVYKLAAPNWVNVNGNLVNTNAPGFSGGLQGGVSASNDGRVTQYMPDGQGGLVVGAPKGAIDTYRAYQGVGNRSAADYTPQEVIDPVTKQKIVRPRSEVLQPTPAPLIGRTSDLAPGAAGNGAGPVNGQPIRNPMAPRPEDADRPFIYSQERQAAQQRLQQAVQSGDPAAIARAQADVAGLEKEIQTNRIALPPLNGAPPVQRPLIGNFGAAPAAPAEAGNVVELSPAQQAANEAAKAAQITAATEAAKNAAANQNAGIASENEAARVRKVDIAKADAARDSAKTTKSINSTDQLNDISRARALLQKGPTGSYVGSKVDSLASGVGYTTPGAELTARLNPVASKLVQNVPRMEGPQSDRDVEEYKNAAGRVNDSTLPAKLRLAALDEVERITNRYAALNGGAADAQKPAAGRTVDALPPANSGNRGRRARDTVTGKVFVSDGMSWKPE